MKKIFLLLIFLLTACSRPLYSGTVTGKLFVPAHKVYRPIRVYTGKHYQTIPNWDHHGDYWEVCVQNEDEKDCWDVSEDFYNSVEVGDFVRTEHLQKVEATLRKWINDWEEVIDIYLTYKDSEDPEEQQIAERAKDLANRIADDYNKLLMQYGNMFGETLPEGIYAAIERTE